MTLFVAYNNFLMLAKFKNKCCQVKLMWFQVLPTDAGYHMSSIMKNRMHKNLVL